MVALFELTELASYLQSDLDTATATRARTRAENYLRVELGVEFASATRTLSERVPATRTYQPLLGPLTSVTTVTVGGTALTANTDYEVTRRGIVCPNGFGADASTDWVTLAIEYVAGFAAIPSELSDWGMHLAAIAYQRGPVPGVRQSTITVDGVSRTEAYGGEASGDGDSMSLPEPILRNLRARYGSGRLRTSTVRVR